MNAVILFSHGSVLCGAGQALETQASRLREQFAIVEVGYLNYSEPDFDVAVRKVAEAGATKVIVVPFFLVPGYFVSKALPDRIANVRTGYPHLEFAIADPIGADDSLALALVESANTAKRSDHWRDGLLEAADSCRKRTDCPLYGTANCRTTTTNLDSSLATIAA